MAHFVVRAAEPVRGGDALEPTRGPDAPFDAAMILDPAQDDY
jgi:hypothetical protein